MSMTITAEVINITEPIKLDNTFASDIHILREQNERQYFNQLKLFHFKEKHGVRVGHKYEFEISLGGRKTKDNRIFNEIKIVHYKILNNQNNG